MPYNRSADGLPFSRIARTRASPASPAFWMTTVALFASSNSSMTASEMSKLSWVMITSSLSSSSPHATVKASTSMMLAIAVHLVITSLLITVPTIEIIVGRKNRPNRAAKKAWKPLPPLALPRSG